jgi:glycosyltransferase involved in cell wall biosynthesis
MIAYEVDIGFAIGRLVEVFHEMALRWAGDSRRVHFSFARVDGKGSANLPQGFANLLEFDYRKSGPADVRRLSAYIQQHQIEVIFALDMGVQCACLKSARLAGVRTVISYWGAPMSSIVSSAKLILKRLDVRFLRRSRPDYFVFESEAMRRFGVLGRGLDGTRTEVIPTGIDAERFRRMPEAASIVHDRFGIPRDRIIVVYMGHLHRRKGVHVLMGATEHWVHSMGRQDVHCLFLGNRENELAEFRGEFNVAAPFITFGGYQSDIPELLSGCAIGCVPSAGWDSFPMSSLEMQSCGLPVVVSDLQGVPETIVDQVTGVVVPAGDAVALAGAIISLVDDPARRERMSLAARRRIVDGFTRDRQIDSLTRFLSDVLGASPNAFGAG